MAPSDCVRYARLISLPDAEAPVDRVAVCLDDAAAKLLLVSEDLAGGAPSGIPALTPEDAGNIVADAITYKPRRLSPPVGSVAAFADSVSPWLMDQVRNQAYQLFPDSKSSRGDTAVKEEEQETGVVGRAFAQVTRGVHW